MPDTTPTTELDTRFSDPAAAPRPWPEVEGVLESSEIFWLSTVRRDGRPHVTPLPAMWLDRALHFGTGPEEQKARNLEGNDQVVLTTGTSTFRAGLDVVVEGTAVRVTDEDLLHRLADLWRSKLDWPFGVVDGGFRVTTPDGDVLEGGGVAHVFAVAPTKVLAFGKGDPFSQTRYRF